MTGQGLPHAQQQGVVALQGVQLILQRVDFRTDTLTVFFDELQVGIDLGRVVRSEGEKFRGRFHYDGQPPAAVRTPGDVSVRTALPGDCEREGTDLCPTMCARGQLSSLCDWFHISHEPRER